MGGWIPDHVRDDTLVDPGRLDAWHERIMTVGVGPDEYVDPLGAASGKPGRRSQAFT